VLDAVVVGAGQAGLALSWHLARRGIEHAVLEQGRVGESWRSQRWDSFALNTPAWCGVLPGEAGPSEPRDRFLLRDEWIAQLDAYATDQRLPVRAGVRVTSLEAASGGEAFLLRLDDRGTDPLLARSVVLACGFQRAPKRPAIAAGLPPGIHSIHTAEYRRPDALPPGGVLVVGSAQSGGQIAEDLLDAGRRVYVSASAVARVPRRYRGREVFEWLVPAGFVEQTPEQLADPRMRFAAQPIISGVGRYGHTLSLQLLAARGATLLGRLVAIEGRRLRFADDLTASIRFADRASTEVRRDIDRAIAASGRSAPPLEPDPADEPTMDPEAIVAPAELDLEREGVTSVVWATGFGPDLSWVRLPIVDPAGAPLHEGGRSPVPGAWFVGIPWMRKRKSGIIIGADEDGGIVADGIAEFLASPPRAAR
jgi:putative flavoprotein involved in K+ transport